jgi:hypothetical protein
LTVTPCRDHSTASARVNPATADLLAVVRRDLLKADERGRSSRRQISRPLPRAIIEGANNLIRAKHSRDVRVENAIPVGFAHLECRDLAS